MKNFNKKIFALLVCSLIATTMWGQLLKVSGKKIVQSSNNQEVILDAVNLGNWMVMEGYIMQSGGAASYQHDFKEKLISLIGQTQTNQFYDAWLKNYVTQADIKQIKAWGFNSVRIPIHYEYFTSLTENVWYSQGFDMLSAILDWCAAEGVYAIIDLHAAPGGQGTGDICDYDNTKPSLWESSANQAKTVALWKEISNRYKNRPWVAGYDLINETHWTLADNNKALRDIYVNITNAVRANGDNHILFIEGNWYANDFNGLTPAWDANMVYSFHKYWAYNDKATIQGYLNLRDSENRPLWCGETGENSNSHYTMEMELFKEYGIGSSWWPMKKFESINGFASANIASGYKEIINYWNNGGTKPNATAAYNTMMQMAENLKLANCKVNTDMVYAIISQPNNRNTKPFATNNLPGTLYAPNYDYGFQDVAYWDEAWEDLHVSTKADYTAWNNGWAYRNDGVDIEKCADGQSNGYSIGWINSGEWTQYTSTFQSSGIYKIDVRVANGGSPATMQIKDGASTVLATINIPATGGWNTWATYSINNITIKSGIKPIRVQCTSGAYNMASVTFTLVTPINDAPIGQTIWLQNNSKYVSSNNGGAPMTCDRPTAQGWEKFDVIDAGNGKVALKGTNGQYVSSENGTTAMNCNRTSYGDWEKFDWVVVSSTQVALKGNNGKYVSSENGATSGMICDRASYSGWEVFNWATTLKSVALSVNDDQKEISSTLYPNPFTYELYLNNSGEATSISICDLSGKIITNQELTSGTNSINVTALEQGLYIAKVFKNNSVNNIKVVKK